VAGAKVANFIIAHPYIAAAQIDDLEVLANKSLGHLSPFHILISSFTNKPCFPIPLCFTCLELSPCGTPSFNTTH